MSAPEEAAGSVPPPPELPEPEPNLTTEDGAGSDGTETAGSEEGTVSSRIIIKYPYLSDWGECVMGRVGERECSILCRL